MSKIVEAYGRNTRIRIYVKPLSKTQKLVLEGDELVFYTSEPPIHGRANAALIKFLAKELDLASSRIRIVYGYREKLKVLELVETTPEKISEKIYKIAQRK